MDRISILHLQFIQKPSHMSTLADKYILYIWIYLFFLIEKNIQLTF